MFSDISVYLSMYIYKDELKITSLKSSYNDVIYAAHFFTNSNKAK